MNAPTLQDIRQAAARIAPVIQRTPVLTCQTLDRLCAGALFFKCENFQKTGSFKMRGAGNAVLSLTPEDAARGVATHSSGNHGAALALSARRRGIPAYVVMPENAPAVKKDAVAGYGATIVYCQPTLEAREAALSDLSVQTGAVCIPPYNDYRVIAGQATAALELWETVAELDGVLAPVGGGGLLSGTALALAALSPATRIIGAEPEQADDAFRSLRAGRIIPALKPDTIADGLRASLGKLTFPIIQRHVREIITVGEGIIIEAMRLLWERMKIVVEPSAAVALAAVLARPDDFAGRRVGIILSGGNVDLDHLPWSGRRTPPT